MCAKQPFNKGHLYTTAKTLFQVSIFIIKGGMYMYIFALYKATNLLLYCFLSSTAADRATCTVPGECECIQGYSGLLCQNDDDVCGHTSPCANDATCNNAGSNDYTCTCPSGYTGDTCSEEVDACVVDADAPLPCQNGGTCTVSNCMAHYIDGSNQKINSRNTISIL